MLFAMHMTITSLAAISLHHSPLEVSIKLRMSFRVELIGISLALGTNDIVTGKRSIVVPTPTNQFVDVTHR